MHRRCARAASRVAFEGATQLKLHCWFFSILLAGASGVSAQSFPTKPIRFIVPFPPGGGTDLVVRTIGQKMTESLGQQVLADNRPGAQGSIGTAIAARAAPDGYTLVLGETGTLCINPHLYRNAGYDAQRDFAPVALVTRQSYLIVVNPAVPAGSVAELIAHAKLGQGKLTFGTSGAPAQIAGELFRIMAGIEMTHVPYKGGGPALIDLLGGHLSMTFTTPAPVLSFLREGRLRALAVTTRSRVDFLPEVPTVIESGIADFEITGWYGVLAPANTPRAIVARLNAELVRIARQPDVRERLTRSGAQLVGSSAEEFAALIRTEVERWGKAVQRTGVRAAGT
jgi:tripartite-type tricarboxylate transporter receptor subunit TctC